MGEHFMRFYVGRFSIGHYIWFANSHEYEDLGQLFNLEKKVPNFFLTKYCSDSIMCNVSFHSKRGIYKAGPTLYKTICSMHQRIVDRVEIADHIMIVSNSGSYVL